MPAHNPLGKANYTFKFIKRGGRGLLISPRKVGEKREHLSVFSYTAVHIFYQESYVHSLAGTHKCCLGLGFCFVCLFINKIRESVSCKPDHHILNQDNTIQRDDSSTEFFRQA